MGLEQKKPLLTQSERLNAIAWKARELKMSYGVYQARLTEAGRDKVYREYAELLRRRREAEQERLAAYARQRGKTK